MTAAKVSEDEFIKLWNDNLGSAVRVSEILGVQVREIYKRRRSVEDRRGEMLLCKTGSGKSPDRFNPDVRPEFPDWQHIEIKDGLLVVFSDSHLVPGTLSTAHRALLKFCSELKPKACIDNGDLLDFASISRHHRIGWDRQLKVSQEIEWAGDCLHQIKKVLPKGCITKRNQGNHDQRFSGFFSNRVPEAEGIKGITLDDHIVGWPCAWATRINDDQLEVKHRWKSGIHAPFNNAMWAGMSYGTGHAHSQKVMPITDLRGDRWGVDVGTLAAIYGPHFRYMEASPRNHRSGFAVFRFVNHKLRIPELVRVIDEDKGLVEWRGQDYTV